MKSDDKHNVILVGVRASVALGFAVFAVVKGGKKPAFAHSFKHATKDLKLASRFFTIHSGLNYRIAAAAASPMFLLDVGRRRSSRLLAVDDETIADVGWELIVERDRHWRKM